MPFYVYTCPQCGAHTELLRPAAARDEPARCEHCGSEKAVRGGASYAVAASRSSAAASFSGGSGCGSGGFT